MCFPIILVSLPFAQLVCVLKAISLFGCLVTPRDQTKNKTLIVHRRRIQNNQIKIDGIAAYD